MQVRIIQEYYGKHKIGTLNAIVEMEQTIADALIYKKIVSTDLEPEAEIDLPSFANDGRFKVLFIAKKDFAGSGQKLSNAVKTIPEAESKIALLSASWKEGNLTYVHDISHSLKGSSANLGAMALSSLFEKIQECVDDGNVEPIAALLSAIANEWPRTRELLESVMHDIAD